MPLLGKMTNQPLLDKDARRRVIADIKHMYFSGKPFYQKWRIACLDSFVEFQKTKATVIDLTGDYSEIQFDPEGFHDGRPTHIHFNTYQELVDPLNRANAGYLTTTIKQPRLPNPITVAVAQDGETKSQQKAEEISARLEQMANVMDDSDWCKNLENALSTMDLPRNLRRIVAFGLGTLSAPREEEHHHPCYHTRHGESSGMFLRSQRAALQTALVALIKHVLESRPCVMGFPKGTPAYKRPQLAVYLQDPAYTADDVSVLAGCGMEVVEGNSGFALVDEDTVVVSINPGIPVKQILADIARPAVLLIGRVGTVVPTMSHVPPGLRDPDSPRVLEWIKLQYTSYDFSPDKMYLDDAVLYIRNDHIVDPENRLPRGLRIRTDPIPSGGARGIKCKYEETHHDEDEDDDEEDKKMKPALIRKSFSWADAVDTDEENAREQQKCFLGAKNIRKAKEDEDDEEEEEIKREEEKKVKMNDSGDTEEDENKMSLDKLRIQTSPEVNPAAFLPSSLRPEAPSTTKKTLHYHHHHHRHHRHHESETLNSPHSSTSDEDENDCKQDDRNPDTITCSHGGAAIATTADASTQTRLKFELKPLVVPKQRRRARPAAAGACSSPTRRLQPQDDPDEGYADDEL